ncbi:hypothetical protein LCGC14_2327680 [marine sediment metagenome]|uniref:Uncharacterized protein n=1 Tax=marine sediment metagenome TaxID=412755 RepID=A0A0F9D3B9_9ZZZZ
MKFTGTVFQSIEVVGVAKLNCRKDRCSSVDGHCRKCLKILFEKTNTPWDMYWVVGSGQVIIVYMRMDDKTVRKPRTVAIGQVHCSPQRCMEVSKECRTCFDYLKNTYGEDQLADFAYREKMNNSGGHHLRGDYEIPVLI